MKLKRKYKLYKLGAFGLCIIKTSIFVEYQFGFWSLRTWQEMRLPKGKAAKFVEKEEE